MPGAGSSTVAFAPEDSYLGGVGGTPTYYLPGTNVEVQTAELNRNLLRLVLPGDVEASDFIAQQFDGQLSIRFVLQNDDFHRLVFNDGFTGFTSGTVNSAEWYLGVDLLDGTTVERQIKGWVPATADISYNGTTEAVTVTMTGPYGDETKNTSITPGTIANTSTGDEVPGHGCALKLNGSRVSKLQSATLSFDQISRLIFDSNSPKPVAAAAGNVQETVELTDVVDDTTQYEMALGGVSATSLQDFVDAQSATVAFDHDGTTIADYSLSTIKPESYNWADLVNNDADLNEEVTFNAAGVTASDPTA